jgi:hypothetical protein
MESVHEWTGAPVEVTIAGNNYRLSPLRIRHLGEMERHLLSQRPDPLDQILPRLPELSESAQRVLLERAYDELLRGPRIPWPELHHWMQTPEGKIYQFWLAARDHQPELTLELAEELICQAGAAALQAIERAASDVQEDLLGN